MNEPAMRLAGRLSEWNDDKGFGFVVPNGGGERAFVHVNDFQRGSKRPAMGDLISYLPSKDPRGRRKATQIRHAGQKVVAPRAPSRVPRATLGWMALAALAALAAVGVIPVAVAAAHFGLSALAYLMYSLDKAAAQGGGQRTAENTLHLVSLAGGWPGALVAQQRLRHKTIKQPFQAIFWITVAVNVVAVAWLVHSGTAARLAQALGG